MRLRFRTRVRLVRGLQLLTLAAAIAATGINF
jgi:hypothetical protein